MAMAKYQRVRGTRASAKVKGIAKRDAGLEAQRKAMGAKRRFFLIPEQRGASKRTRATKAWQEAGRGVMPSQV